MALMGGASLACLALMRLDETPQGTPPPEQAGPCAPGLMHVLTGTPALRVLAVAMLLFHLGNAAMLPLLGQAAVARGHANPSGFTALTIIVAQLVMIPMALLAGRHAQRGGYWLLVKAALLSLPLRGLVAATWDSDWALIPVQVLDGVGAGLLGVALPGLVAQTLRGTGHVNAGLGAVMTLQGLGAAASPALAGWIAQRFGFDAAFLSLGGIAVLALALCLTAGLDGIERGLTPPAEITENIFAMDAAARKAHGIDSLPGSLEEAIRALEADPLILDTLGSHVASYYIEGKRKEWEEYRTRVSSWEREKYIINY